MLSKDQNQFEIISCHMHFKLFSTLQLRTVHTNGKYFFPDNDYLRQEDHIRVIEIQNKNWGNHAFFRDNCASK